MQKVILKHWGTGKVQKQEMEFPGTMTVREFLQWLPSQQDGDLGKLQRYAEPGAYKNVIITINGTNILSMGGLDAEVSEGDTISVLPTVAGGA
jgi:molybdopterin converting factor small subunit